MIPNKNAVPDDATDERNHSSTRNTFPTATMLCPCACRSDMALRWTSGQLESSHTSYSVVSHHLEGELTVWNSALICYVTSESS